MKFYIQDTRSYSGDAVIWWRPNRKGYTFNIDDAGLYEEEEARSIERVRGTDKAVPQEVAQAAIIRVVDATRLRSELGKVL